MMIAMLSTYVEDCDGIDNESIEKGRKQFWLIIKTRKCNAINYNIIVIDEIPNKEVFIIYFIIVMWTCVIVLCMQLSI
jgi:hypothetical protein